MLPIQDKNKEDTIKEINTWCGFVCYKIDRTINMVITKIKSGSPYWDKERKSES